MNLIDIADNIELKDGIWFSKNTSEISYPKDGNQLCFQIEEHNFWFKHRNNCITETIKNFFSGIYFVDVGGGNGYLASELEKNGIQTLLVEPGIDGILNARKKGLKNLLCSTLENAVFRNASLNAIGIFDVLEHKKDDLFFLSTIGNILTEKGQVFLTVPSFNILWSGYDDLAGHYHRYTLQGITEKLEQAGFKIEYATYIFSILPIPIFLFRTIPSAIGMKRHCNIDTLRRDLVKNDKIFGRFSDKIWAQEISLIKRKKKIPFGSTCLVVARKKPIIN